MPRKATKKPMNTCPVCGAGHYNATYCSQICAGQAKSEQPKKPQEKRR